MVVNWLLAMFSLLVSWVGLGALFAGWGLLLRRMLGKRLGRVDDLPDAFWLGWGGLIVALMLSNFWFPVKGSAFGLFTLGGIAGLLYSFGDLVRIARHLFAARSRPALICGVVLAILGLFTANRALGAPINPDAGFYYLSSVRYAVEYPALPGIGNLHTRLAYNNSNFLYTALLEAGLWTNRSQHAASGLLMLAMLLRVLIGGVRVFVPLQPGMPARLSEIFVLVFFGPWLALLLGRNVSCPAPDLAMYIVGFECCVKLLDLLERRGSPNELDRSGLAGWPLIHVIFLSVIGVTIKLSFVALGGLASVVALMAVFSARPAHCIRGIGISIALAAVVLGLWGARGVVLSGYPLYPNTSLDFHEPWAIPKEIGEQEVKSVYHSARDNKADLEKTAKFGNWGWLPGWLGKQVSKDQRYHALIPMVLALGFSLAALICCRNRRETEPLSAWPMWIALPLLGALLFWFLTAPHPRFAGVIFWGMAASAFAYWLAASGWHRNIYQTNSRGFAAAALFLIITAALNPLTYSPVIYPAQYPHGFYPLPEPEMAAFVTNSGLKLWKPVNDPPYCYNAELPCTPYPNPYVRLRKAGDITQGFDLDPGFVARVKADAVAAKQQEILEKE